MMAFSMRDETFKVQMFRFVDVLASLRRSGDIVAHLREYFRGMDSFIPMLQTGLRAAGIFLWLTAFILRRNVSGMARQFIAGRDGADVMKTLRRKRKEDIGFTVDLLGEAVVSEKEANEYAARAMELLDTLSRETRGWTDPLGKNTDFSRGQSLAQNLGFYSQMDPAAPGSQSSISRQSRPICPRPEPVLSSFDMESYAQKNGTLDLFKSSSASLSSRIGAHRDYHQAYLRDAERDLKDLIGWGRKRGTRFAVRLVKGAYWDYEKIIAQQNGWICPVFLQKPESDANFEVCTRILLDNESIVTAAFGSHNVRSIAYAMSCAEELGIDKSRFEFQLLYGMAGPIKRALVELHGCGIFAGRRTASGMSYLVRRLLEHPTKVFRLNFPIIFPSQLLRDPNDLVSRDTRAPVGERQPTKSFQEWCRSRNSAG
jgi:RHH-type proline utilization regulon transcriptional repressor/proline dehydrogenase/delta 1-pyrroline-5-carboxylate dehydrogenase